MSAVSSSHHNTLFELKNATLTLIALVLKTTDLELLSAALEERFGPTPALFDHDPVVIDLSQIEADAGAIDFVALNGLLRGRRMLPVGVERGAVEQMAAALAAGLGDSSTFATPVRTAEPHDPARDGTSSTDATAQKAQSAAAERATEAADAMQAEAKIAAASGSSPRQPAPSTASALVIDRPLRSGQQVYARGDLVVMAAVNFGAEVIADGHIHVYAPLRGRAIAGARGNTAARIFSTAMEPQLVSIAGTYRTIDAALPDDVFGKPAQVRLDGDALLIEALVP